MIIGISGKIGAGKDALGAILAEEYGFTINKFANQLKFIAALLTGLDLADMFSESGKEKFLPDWNMTVGELQQRLGTDAIRNNLHQDAWVLATFASYTAACNWVITDMRFPNEAAAIRRRSGLLVRIDGSRTGPGNRDPNHPSETALDRWNDWDYRFDNTHLNRVQLTHHAQCIAELAQRKNLLHVDV